jgi:hypothetical protein
MATSHNVVAEKIAPLCAVAPMLVIVHRAGDVLLPVLCCCQSLNEHSGTGMEKLPYRKSLALQEANLVL